MGLGTFLVVGILFYLVVSSIQRVAKRHVEEAFDRRVEAQQRLAYVEMAAFRERHPEGDLYDTWEHGTLALVRLGMELGLAQSLAEQAMREALRYEPHEYVDYMDEFRQKFKARAHIVARVRARLDAGIVPVATRRVCHICGESNGAQDLTCSSCSARLPPSQ